MTLRQKEYLSIGMGLAGGVLGLIGSQIGAGWTPLTMAGLALIIVALVLRFAWHRCPYCSSYLGRHWERSCPSCGRWIDYDAK